MNPGNLPKTFWYALSFCMVAATLGLLVIAYRASTVSIEIADAKINLSSALSDVKEVKTNLEIENEKLLSANAELTLQLQNAGMTSGEISRAPSAVSSSKTVITTDKNLELRKNNQKALDEINKKLEQVDVYLKKL